MTPVPLGELRLRPGHHRSALWWLGLLYRRPNRLQANMSALSRLARLRAGVTLCLHGLPWLFLLIFTIQTFLFFGLDLPGMGAPVRGDLLDLTLWQLSILALVMAGGIAAGIAVGMAGGIAGGIAVGITAGTVAGTAGAVADPIALGLSQGGGLGMAVGIANGIVGGMPSGITGCITGGILGGILGGITGGITVGLAGGIACAITMTRSYYLPFHVLFIWPRALGGSFALHPVAWDDLCLVSFPGLHRLLVAFTKTDRIAGEAEIERLIGYYPSQHMEALKARTVLVAEAAGAGGSLAGIDEPLNRLPQGSAGFQRDIPKVREGVAAIAQRQRQLDTIQIPAHRRLTAELLVKDIQSFRDRAAGFAYPLNEGFRAAAERWLVIAERQLADTQAVLEAEPVPQIFRAGDPVDREREAFLPRMPVIEELQGLITLRNGCPGILLYGRRRMGKSTLVKNLQPFLPRSILVADLSMQDPRASGSLEGLLYQIARSVCFAVGTTLVADAGKSLARFFAHLDSADSELAKDDRRLLLAIDEYEQLDAKLGEQVYPLDLLHTFRESIQAHRRIVWMFTGSHGIEELTHAEWPSFFVSLRTVELGPFTAAETSLLLTDPLQRSELYRDHADQRPRFDAGFWGEGGIERIHAEAAGWPHLVQLLAETVVELLNLRGRRSVSPALLEEAAEKAIVRGENVLIQLVRNESRLPGEWEYLWRFRQSDAQPPPTDEAVHRSLRRRLMVVEEGGLWRMRVPLMQRWLRERA